MKENKDSQSMSQETMKKRDVNSVQWLGYFLEEMGSKLKGLMNKYRK